MTDKPVAGRDATEHGFRTLFGALQDAAMVVSPTSRRIRAVNPATVALLGFSEQALCEMTPDELHPHELPALSVFLDRAVTRGQWWSRTLSCRARSGDTIPVEVRASRVALSDGDGLLLLIRDLRTDELVQTGRSLRKLMHDLRNTLTTSQLISDRMRSHDDPAVQRGALVISRSVERAVRMSRSILEQRELDAPVPDRERFLLADVTEEVFDALPETGLNGGAVLDVAGGDLILDADFDQVYRIVLNLCRNALDAGARRLRVCGCREGDTPAIDVCDDGPGLPGAVRDRLFDAGGPGSTRGSSGLGLMIVRELARAHGGGLGLVESGPSGTTFRVTLPPAEFGWASGPTETEESGVGRAFRRAFRRAE